MYVKMSNLSNVRKILVILDRMGYEWINKEPLLPWWDNLPESEKSERMRCYYLRINNQNCDVSFTEMYCVDHYERDSIPISDIEYIKRLCSKERYFILNKEVENV